MTGIEVGPMGVGTWAWGDRSLWRFGESHGMQDVRQAFDASVQAGLTFFDTAEIYGGGLSELIVGGLVAQSTAPITLATKYAPLLGRFTGRSVRRALAASLTRIGKPRIDLYQVHWPRRMMGLGRIVDAMADAVAEGLVRAVGVSNFGTRLMIKAHDLLQRRGLVLASNQVAYSLLERGCEANGLLQACRERGITLIAHTPLAQGRLTGKYRPDTAVTGARCQMPSFQPAALARNMPLIEALERIGRAHGKTPAQVALNWLLRQPGVLPIPGAKNREQASDNAGALGWEMTEEQGAELGQISQP